MGLGPVHATTPLLKRNRLALGKIDAWEINEAFATQVLACLRAWEDKHYCQDELGLRGTFGSIDQTLLNVDGGGGEPGSSGRHQRRAYRLALAACAGSG